MTVQTYFYNLTDFPNDAFDAETLAQQINANDSGVTTQLSALPYGTTQGGLPKCAIPFKAEVNSVPALDAIVAAHTGVPNPVTMPVAVTNQLQREDGAVYAVPKPSTYGYVMCDRDFRVNTCIMDAAQAFEDLKVIPATNTEAPWAEMSLNGVYKLDNGSMVLCADQNDANTNGILSVWDYCAKLQADQTTLITYELRDGLLFVDPGIYADKNAPTPTERFGHRAYAVLAPDIPGAAGGSIAIFDGYLGSNPDSLKIEATSPQATVLDPAGPGGAAGVLLRLYIFHPAGSKLSHILRLVAYRAPGTF